MDASVPGIMSLADWRREIFDIYALVRAHRVPSRAWELWRDTRGDLLTSHPQSPLPAPGRGDFRGPFVFDYEPDARVLADLEPLGGDAVEVGTSDGSSTRMLRFGRATFQLFDHSATLDIFWLDQYGGGIYLAFRDASSGRETYGGGRYLLDTVKGADLGVDGDRLILDFNFAYQPSCSYDPRWSCPLPPPENTLSFEVRAGERIGPETG